MELLVYYAFPILWIALTFTSLLVFQISMARARIRNVHMARCLIYSADVLIWTSTLVSIRIALDLARLLGLLDLPTFDRDEVVFALGGVGWLFFVHRLRTALTLYARFDHPTATVLATQVITLLTILVLFFNAIA